MSKALSLLVLVTGFVIGASAPANAGGSCVNVSTSQVSSPHTASENAWGGTRLNSGDSALIEQTETSGTQVCHALTSFNTNSIFVPWKTSAEWTAFLTAATGQSVGVYSCCAPLTVNVCSSPTPVPLGYRYLGVPLDASNHSTITLHDYSGAVTTDMNHWAAQNDIYGPICASNVLADPTINYEVTYTCTGGSWIKTREVGSCIPLDGQCSSLAGTSMSDLPTNTQTLCGTGSIVTNLTQVNDGSGNKTGWAWTCDGTLRNAGYSACTAGDTLADHGSGLNCSAQCNATFKAKVDGVCGTDNGSSLPSLVATDTNLCAVGVADGFAPVLASNGRTTLSWKWSCLGTGGGATTSCAATKGTFPPQCGPVTGGSYTGTQMSAFTQTDLCTSGRNTSISGGGDEDWFGWSCTNSLGSVDCYATNTKVDGSCGYDNGSIFGTSDGTPGGSLCYNSLSTAVGFQYTSTGSSTGYWGWTCSGINGGATSSACNATFNANKHDAVCGPLDGSTQALVTIFSPGLCSIGTPGVPYPTNQYWAWTCYGLDGGNDANCGAYNTLAPGACGDANGSYFLGTPRDDLCDYGAPSTPILIGNVWTWTCQGSGVTPPSVCSGYVQDGQCGYDNNSTSVNAPSASLCYNGNASSPVLDGGHTQWSWTCSTAHGSTDHCSASVANGVCGSAKNGLYSVRPASNLCNTGTASTAVLSGDSSQWLWTCSTAYGTTASCAATNTGSGSSFIQGTCGSATLLTTSTTPTVGLCSAGTPSTPTLSGSTYSWTCTGSSGGGNASCTSAYSSSASDGSCGNAAGVASAAQPSSNLCATGTSSTPAYNTGFTNWVWSCASTSGGATVSCTAPVTTGNGICGLSNNTYIPNQPNSNLCNAGVSTTVTTNSPWTWTCQGVGGGSNSPTCQATQCNACSGTKTANQSTTISGVVSGCSISANVAWTETDSLAASGGANSYNITWTDALGSHSSSTIIPTTTTFCQPCYGTETGFSGLTATITSATGTCSGYSVGSTLPISNAVNHN